MRKLALFFLILLVDGLSKFLVSTHLPIIDLFRGFPFGGIGLVNTTILKCSIVHTTNTGTAWGLFSQFQGVLLAFRIAVVLGICFYLWRVSVPKYLQYALILVLAGAVGNICDFFLYGHVVDMFYCIFYKYSYPIFNVADSSIFCALAYLFIRSWGRKKSTKDALI